MLTGVLFLDLKKAFDTVDHKILLQKLNMYGLDYHSLCWFENYLNGRTQCTKVNNTLSNYLPITCRVPQRPILGPLMFILYISDVDKVISDCSISLYADDTALYYANLSHVDLMLTLRDDIDSISQWLNLDRLTLNTKKTKYMIVGT